MELTKCPRLYVPGWVWELADLAELFEKGLAPMPGGVLDQVDAFLSGCRIYWAERNRIRAEVMRKKFGDAEW